MEGTLGVGAAYERLGKAAQSGSILDEMCKIQSTWSSLGLWNGALPYAMQRYVSPDGDTFAEWKSVAATGWYSIFLTLRKGPSRFWDHD